MQQQKTNKWNSHFCLCSVGWNSKYGPTVVDLSAAEEGRRLGTGVEQHTNNIEVGVGKKLEVFAIPVSLTR